MTAAQSAVRIWNEIHRLERELVLAHSARAAQRVGDGAGHRDAADLTQGSRVVVRRDQGDVDLRHFVEAQEMRGVEVRLCRAAAQDRKSTRLNSSHVRISYAVFCLKKKKKNHELHSVDTKRTNNI